MIPRPTSFTSSNTLEGTQDISAVYLAEYQALRQEVNNRQTVSSALIAADLTALGVGLSAAHQYPEVLIALGIISSLLWLFWLVHTLQIYRIALYVALELRPRLIKIYKVSLLDWEAYVRLLVSGQGLQDKLIKKYNLPAEPRSKISRNIDGIYISMLFGGATPLLIAAAVIADVHHALGKPLWQFGVAVTLALWVYALARAINTFHSTKVITSLIISAQQQGQHTIWDADREIHERSEMTADALQQSTSPPVIED